MYQELIHTEEREGFTIKFYACEEDQSLADSFEAEDVAELEEKVNNGTLMWFCAKVTAEKAGVVLGTDYLGACCYETAMQFVEHNDYYADMVDTVIAEARSTIAELTA